MQPLIYFFKALRSRSRCAGTLMACLGVAMPVSAAAPVVLTGVKVDALQLISSARVSGTLYNDTYTASVSNSSSTTFVANVEGTVTSANGSTRVIQGTLSIGDVPASSTVTASGTIVIQQDRTHPFVSGDLIWTVSGNPIAGAVPPPDPGPPGNETLAGTDANNNGVRDDVERFILIEFAAPSERRALFQYSIAMQSLILAGDSSTAAKEGATELLRGLECLCSVAQPYDASLVEEAFANTKPRSEAYLSSMLLSAQPPLRRDPAQYGLSCK